MSHVINRDHIVTSIKARFTSLSELAARLDVSRQLLHYYLNTHFPLEQALMIDAMTDGELSWRDLCPPVYSRLAQYREQVKDLRQLELPFDEPNQTAIS